MLVAMLVGAIRTAIETSADPRDVLDALNRRLLGRSSANATCLALCIQSDGAVTLANAGSLPPYLNGVEVPMEDALPLGTIPGAEFSISHFQIGKGDTLTLISDGILEAQDKDGHLFGFERVSELLRIKVSAAALAAAAQIFGQEDDISVVSVTRAV
jgi:serine phosphatase RsbU (regulator of sigma subunit)